ncbi:MAG TPA: AI-2E family transporter [Burkholderiales bacterium]|nr:AI-2E family transporter [Burkholderiales bacterium]
MSAYISTGSRPHASSIVALLITAAVLYLAQEVLIPLAVAILLAFLLAPAVRRLEQWKLPRVAATLVVALLGFGVIFGVAGIAATQAVSLGAQLPEYRHNIAKKIQAIRHPKRDTNIGKAAEAIKDIEKQAAPERPPVPVKETPANAFEATVNYLAPVAKPLAMAIAVIVFTIMMLINRESMRERVIALIGPGRIQVTTKAMAEASYRVSRYLTMQLVVNAMFGIPFGVALYFIGIPNALFFGLLGMVLRFIPYAGVWVAAAMPAILGFAISDTWTPVFWTLGVFFALESLLAYVIEPWLYGKSAGLTPIAIIVAVVFWTWLWGPIGLLLATPLTVCVAVMGRHIPELGFLNLLLGVEPVLSPEERFYQRLIALDHEEAGTLAEAHVAAHGIAATFDDVILPALTRLEADRRKGAIEPARERFVCEHIARMVEELGEAAPAGAAGTICITPARGEPDRLAALMVARLVAAEVGEPVAQKPCKAILISAVPPNAAHDARYLARRFRREFPGTKIVLGLWTDAHADARERLGTLGADEVVTRISEAADVLRRLAGGNERMRAGMARELLR